jgi:hypothetical protein
MYNSRSTNTDSYKWFRLVFPANVHLADDRTEDLRHDTWRNHIYQPVYPGPSAAELAAAAAAAAAVQAATAQAAREAGLSGSIGGTYASFSNFTGGSGASDLLGVSIWLSR